MKSNKSGFSIVEIMVSMVILSIVMLVMSNVIIVSSLEHSAASGRDDGELVARQKLNELQNPAIIPTSGSGTITFKEQAYEVVWTVTTTKPMLATVTASWTQDGKTRSAKAAGYIESTNSCLDISPNTNPSAIELYTALNVKITATTIALAHGTPANRFICRLYGVDKDTVSDDQVNISFAGGTSDNDKFIISGDTLYTKVVLNSASTSYSVKLQAFDCRNASGTGVTKDFTVSVGAQNTRPKAPAVQDTFTINENSAINTVAGTLVTDEANFPTDLAWSGGTSPFTVAADGQIKVSSAILNYEGTKSYNFTATLKRVSTNEDTVVNVRVTLKDVNEAPISISLSSKTTFTTTAINADVATITIKDPDSSSLTTAWGSIATTTENSSKFKVIGNKLQVEASLSAAAGLHPITFTATDGAGLSFVKTDTITITSPVVTVNCTGVPNFVVWTGSNPVGYNGGWGGATPSVVLYGGKKWKGNAGQYQWSNSNGIPGVFSWWDLEGVCP